MRLIYRAIRLFAIGAVAIIGVLTPILAIAAFGAASQGDTLPAVALTAVALIGASAQSIIWTLRRN